jgi:pyruvate,water dikinase
LQPYTIPFARLGRHDVATVGGKNSSLGEMISQLAAGGRERPGGFATTAAAFRDFLDHDYLAERIARELAALDVDDVARLAETGARFAAGCSPRRSPTGCSARSSKTIAPWGPLAKSPSPCVRPRRPRTCRKHRSRVSRRRCSTCRGAENVVKAVHEVFASLFNDRAIAYRVHQGFDHANVALSAGVQHMVRSDLGASGVMFTLDTDSGFREVVFITASWGLGETVVQGAVNP